MANPTSAFGWQMPTNTDLVKDLPADFEVFGQAVDTTLADLKGGTNGQVLSKASDTDMDFTWVSPTTGDITGVTAGTGLSGGGTSGDVTVSLTSPVSETLGGTGQTTYTTGNILYASATNTLSKLGIGSTGQFLSVSGGVPAWVASPSSQDNWTLLNTGGTALTGAQTITVSGISGRNKILVAVQSGSSTSGQSTIVVRLNGYSTNIYYRYGWNLYASSTYSINSFNSVQGNSSWIEMARTSTVAVSSIGGACLIEGCATTGQKVFHSVGGATGNGSTGFENWNIGGFVNLSEAITSVSVFSSDGNFDNGTLYVYATN